MYLTNLQPFLKMLSPSYYHQDHQRHLHGGHHGRGCHPHDAHVDRNVIFANHHHTYLHHHHHHHHHDDPHCPHTVLIMMPTMSINHFRPHITL